MNDLTVELFEAADMKALLGSLADIFLPETETVFVEELVTLWEGRRRFESETVLRILKGRRIDVVFTIARSVGDQATEPRFARRRRV